ncbi:Aldehyde dehydrogenase, glutamic acid active site [Phytophthora cactorum]|nr:Aldehyde dehydrogenase, glutamic acid active site [Phytophthora cactorum]
MVALARLAEIAGVPAGVINVVTAPQGSHSGIGKELTENPDKLMSQASAKHVVLELGGNAPFIVFEDADLDKALDGSIAVVVARPASLTTAFSFTRWLATCARTVEKASELVEDAVIHGAKVLTGGKSSDLGKNFYEATVLTIVNENMRIWGRRFLDLLCRFSLFLGCVPYFPHYQGSWKLEWLRSMLGLDCPSPFGGIKESLRRALTGREGSPEGLEEFLESKTVCSCGLS